MATINRFTKYKPTRYNPRTLQEMMIAPSYMRKRHNALASSIARENTLLSQIDSLDPHSNKVNRMKELLRKGLNERMNQLNESGFSQNSMSNFLKFNQRYQQAMGPEGVLGKAMTAKKNFYKVISDAYKQAQEQGYNNPGAAINAIANRYLQEQADSNEIGMMSSISVPEKQDLMKDLKDVNSLLGEISKTNPILKNAVVKYDPNVGKFKVITEEGELKTVTNAPQLNQALHLLNNKWLMEGGAGYISDVWNGTSHSMRNRMLQRGIGTMLVSERDKQKNKDINYESPGKGSAFYNDGIPDIPYSVDSRGTVTIADAYNIEGYRDLNTTIDKMSSQIINSENPNKFKVSQLRQLKNTRSNINNKWQQSLKGVNKSISQYKKYYDRAQELMNTFDAKNLLHLQYMLELKNKKNPNLYKNLLDNFEGVKKYNETKEDFTNKYVTHNGFESLAFNIALDPSDRKKIEDNVLQTINKNGELPIRVQVRNENGQYEYKEMTKELKRSLYDVINSYANTDDINVKLSIAGGVPGVYLKYTPSFTEGEKKALIGNDLIGAGIIKDENSIKMFIPLIRGIKDPKDGLYRANSLVYPLYANVSEELSKDLNNTIENFQYPSPIKNINNLGGVGSNQNANEIIYNDNKKNSRIDLYQKDRNSPIIPYLVYDIKNKSFMNVNARTSQKPSLDWRGATGMDSFYTKESKPLRLKDIVKYDGNLTENQIKKLRISGLSRLLNTIIENNKGNIDNYNKLQSLIESRKLGKFIDELFKINPIIKLNEPRQLNAIKNYRRLTR